MKKAYDDALVAIYQNGERLMPGNGYPMRLLLPGYQGNMNVKFLRRIKVVDQPAMSFYEARTYSQILPDGKAWRFHFLQEVKSFITHPSFGHSLKGPGYYDISGVAYSGNGRIAKVMVSADGGKSWAEAALQGPVHPKASRASACRGAGTASRSSCKAAPGMRPATSSRCAPSSSRARGETKKPVQSPLAFPNQHYNSLTSWGIDRKGDQACLRVTRSRRRLLALASAPRCAETPRPRQADHRSRHHGLGHRRHAGRHGPAAGPRHRGGRRQGVRREMRGVPRRRRQGRPGRARPLFGGRPMSSGIDTPKTIGNFWGHATTVFDFTRRAMPFNQPRTLTTDESTRHRLSAVPQQDHRRDRGDGRRRRCRR